VLVPTVPVGCTSPECKGTWKNINELQNMRTAVRLQMGLDLNSPEKLDSTRKNIVLIETARTY
jgi:hypothetical protein